MFIPLLPANLSDMAPIAVSAIFLLPLLRVELPSHGAGTKPGPGVHSSLVEGVGQPHRPPPHITLLVPGLCLPSLPRPLAALPKVTIVTMTDPTDALFCRPLLTGNLGRI